MIMKKLVIGLLFPAAFSVASSPASRADEFSQIADCPETYWVPAYPPGYAAAPSPYYYDGPSPYFYSGPPPPYSLGPSVFIGFHIH
jgi:hypothetical protein